MSTVRRRSPRQRQSPKRKRHTRRRILGEQLESRMLLTGSGWQNPEIPLDVNHDEFITSGDALVVVNYLNQNGAAELPARSEGEGGGSAAHSIDVNGDGTASSGDVLSIVNFLNGEGESGAVVQVRIAIFNADGTEEIDTVGLGDEFVVRVLVQDIRMSGRAGVFSSYVDINYDAALTSIVENAFTQLDVNTFEEVPVTIMDNQMQYGQGANGDFSQPGLIDAAGSFSSSIAPLGPTERELFKFKMRANAEGTITFVGSPTTEANDPGDAGQSPTFDTGLYLQDPPVCPSQSSTATCMGEIMYINDSVSVVSEIVAVDDSVTVDERTVADPTRVFDPIDVLGNDIVNVGTLTLESFTAPANGDVVRNADDTFTYTPALSFFGGDSFTYTISNGQGSTSTASVDITVNPINDPPMVTVPGAQTVDEDNALTFGNGTISVSDVDADSGDGLIASLFADNGLITVETSGATVDGNGTSSVSIRGLVGDVNSSLGTVTYTPLTDFNGSDTLTVSSTDQGNFGAGGALDDLETISITINPINDPPINVVPPSYTVFNTETLTITDIRVDDVDAENLSITLAVGEGTLTLGSTSGLTEVTGDGTPSLAATGPIAAVNDALIGLVYDPTDGFTGSDSLVITSSDLGGTGAGGVLTDTDTVTLTITPPELPFAVPDIRIMEEDGPMITVDVLLNDLPPDGGNTLTITQLNGLAVTQTPNQTTSNGGAVSFSGGTFTYEPPANFFGRDTFTYTIESSPNIGDGPSTGTVDIDVLPINDGPLITMLPSSLSVDEDGILTLSGADLIQVDDIDAGEGGVTVTVTVNSGTGILEVDPSGGGSVTDNRSNALTLDGTVTQVNGLLGGLTYAPAADFFGDTDLTVEINDGGRTGGVPGDPTAEALLSDSDTVNITVQPINDAPVIVVPGKQSFFTDFDNRFSTADGNALTISDVDSGNNDVQLELSINQGTFTLTDTSPLTSVSGEGSSTLSLLGNVNAINTVLASGLTYRSDLGGDFTLSASVNDLGNTGGIAGDPGANNPLTATGMVDVEVLDFVPSSVGGFVFLDLNADGIMGSGEGGLEGVEVTLSGVDPSGQPIESQTMETGARGEYLFENLRPGDYTLSKDSLAHYVESNPVFDSPVTPMAGDSRRGVVRIDARGAVDALDNNFPVLGLNSLFADGIDHVTLHNPPTGPLYTSLLFAIDASDPADPSTVVFYRGEWGTYRNARIVLSADGQFATVTVHDLATSRDMSVTLSFSSGSFLVRSMGTMSTVRVFMDPSMFGGLDPAAVDDVLT